MTGPLWSIKPLTTAGWFLSWLDACCLSSGRATGFRKSSNDFPGPPTHCNCRTGFCCSCWLACRWPSTCIFVGGSAGRRGSRFECLRQRHSRELRGRKRSDGLEEYLAGHIISLAKRGERDPALFVLALDSSMSADIAEREQLPTDAGYLRRVFASAR